VQCYQKFFNKFLDSDPDVDDFQTSMELLFPKIHLT